MADGRGRASHAVHEAVVAGALPAPLAPPAERFAAHVARARTLLALGDP
jgi:hypothetical protein